MNRKRLGLKRWDGGVFTHLRPQHYPRFPESTLTFYAHLHVLSARSVIKTLSNTLTAQLVKFVVEEGLCLRPDHLVINQTFRQLIGAYSPFQVIKSRSKCIPERFPCTVRGDRAFVHDTSPYVVVIRLFFETCYNF